MNTDLEFHIKQNYPWAKLPPTVKQSVGNSAREYDKAVLVYSVKNQLRYKGNLVRAVRKDEKQYYEDLIHYSREHLMLYPYHLSDVMVKGLRITPFAYYISIMSDIMSQEKSYDALPNFTAADCLRLLGIGRNQYIDLMNQCHSSKKFFRRKNVRDLLPSQPIEGILIEPWWRVQAGYITEDDVKFCPTMEKTTIDTVIDSGDKPHTTGILDYNVLHSLYRKGLIYLEVPIADDDCIIVPPLEGFVMNRVLGDYFETLLYKIFVSIDEHTPVCELASVLEIDLQLVKHAVSMYCRLGFARLKGQEALASELHSSWKNVSLTVNKKPSHDQLLIDWGSVVKEQPPTPGSDINCSPDNLSIDGSSSETHSLLGSTLGSGHIKRIAFLFDSTLTAFLMMGNLSPGLKSHAVTMFEVGKLSDESLDSFLTELEKVESVAEGEAQRYFDHAVTLRDTVRFFRYNKDLCTGSDKVGQGLDLLRCESLLGLDAATRARVLKKNYSLLVSMAPLSNEIRPVSSCTPQHLGPAIPEVTSVWFKLFLYQLTGSGPPTLLLVKGTRLKRLPKIFQQFDNLLITTWGHDPAVIQTSNILLTLNDALAHSAVLLQGHSWLANTEADVYHIPFPRPHDYKNSTDCVWYEHKAVQHLTESLDLKHTCGYITLMNTGNPHHNNAHSSQSTHSIHESNNTIGQPPCVSSTVIGQHGPTNGLSNSMSAEVLTSELDTLNSTYPTNVDVSPTKSGSQSSNSQSKPDSSKLVLDLSSDTSDNSLEREWCLLELSYGIPLFNADLNQRVCKVVAEQQLYTDESLQQLLESSGMLCLRLLDFIAKNQDLAVVTDGGNEPSMLPSSDGSQDQIIPFPTHNLMYNHGVVSTWQP